jgi:hypothetical protein
MNDPVQPVVEKAKTEVVTRVVNARIPLATHRLLKIESAKRGVRLTQCAAELISERLDGLAKEETTTHQSGPRP